MDSKFAKGQETKREMAIARNGRPQIKICFLEGGECHGDISDRTDGRQDCLSFSKGGR
jgi:hypothetical protein